MQTNRKLGTIGNTAAIAALSACIMLGAVGAYRLTSEGNSTRASEPNGGSDTPLSAEEQAETVERNEEGQID